MKNIKIKYLLTTMLILTTFFVIGIEKTNAQSHTTPSFIRSYSSRSTVLNSFFGYYDDVTGSFLQNPVSLKYNAPGSTYHGQNVYVDGLAVNGNTGIYYAFVMRTPGSLTLAPIIYSDIKNVSQLVQVDIVSNTVTPIDENHWIPSNRVIGAAINDNGELYAIKSMYGTPQTQEVLRVDISTGAETSMGTLIRGIHFLSSITDIVFFQGGKYILGTQDIFGYSVIDLQDISNSYNISQSTIINFDFDLSQYNISGSAVTNDFTARASLATANDCRIVFYEGRNADEFGRANDIFTSNPIEIYSDRSSTGTLSGNSGPGDMASSNYLACAYDYGDAPASYDIDNSLAARHYTFSDTYLGTTGGDIDLPLVNNNNSSDGDDTSGLSDEDGVVLPINFSINQLYSIEVTNTDGFLNAWIDWNGDGTFDDNIENITSDDQAVTLGTTTLVGIVPSNAVIGDSYARFRICSSTVNCNIPLGRAEDGEVEDYMLNITPQLLLCGDSIIDIGETCDDGNTTNGDGCSSICEIESSSSSKKKGSVKFGCKDKDAINYSRFVSHKQSLCRYTKKEIKKEIEDRCNYFKQWSKMGDRDGLFSKYIQESGKKETIYEVSKLQNWLNKSFNFNLKVDGIFGNETKLGVENYQMKFKNYILNAWLPSWGNQRTGNFKNTSRWTANYLMGCKDAPIHFDNDQTGLYSIDDEEVFGRFESFVY